MLGARIDAELAMVRARYPKLEVSGRWVRIPDYPTGAEWNRPTTDVAFQIPDAYPNSAPYAFSVISGLRYGQDMPLNYVEPAPAPPPFAGTWGVFSWSHTESWKPHADNTKGTNLLNWVEGFAQRFRDGK